MPKMSKLPKIMVSLRSVFFKQGDNLFGFCVLELPVVTITGICMKESIAVKNRSHKQNGSFSFDWTGRFFGQGAVNKKLYEISDVR